MENLSKKLDKEKPVNEQHYSVTLFCLIETRDGEDSSLGQHLCYSPDPNCRGGGIIRRGVGDTTQLCSLGGVIIN